MKSIFSLIFVFSLSMTFAQSNSVLFAQCYFDIPNNVSMLEIEADLKLHPNINVVRLDFDSQRAFILTQGIESLTEEEFKAWFEIFSSTVSCIQIGVYGIDKIEPYPFMNCKDD